MNLRQFPFAVKAVITKPDELLETSPFAVLSLSLSPKAPFNEKQLLANFAWAKGDY